jgi:hypothetical protein
MYIDITTNSLPSVTNEHGEVTVTIPLTNVGDGVAYDVQLNEIVIQGVDRRSPSNLPHVINEIAPRQVVGVTARFDASQLAAGSLHYLGLAGTYADEYGSRHNLGLGVDIPIPPAGEFSGPQASNEAIAHEGPIPQFIQAFLVIDQNDPPLTRYRLENHSSSWITVVHLDLNAGRLPDDVERPNLGWGIEHWSAEGVMWKADSVEAGVPPGTTLPGFGIVMHGMNNLHTTQWAVTGDDPFGANSGDVLTPRE